MTETKSIPLPDYTRPPVIEVVYGLQFAPLLDLRTPLIGVLWQRIMQEYPKYKEMPVLAPVSERFDQFVPTEQASVELLDRPPLPRLFFLDASENWVMQVQRDRFHHNWMRTKEGDSYPRYMSVSEKFFEAWNKFSQFLASQNLLPPSLTQCELTYINHIPIEEGRSTIEEIQTVFPDFRWQSQQRFLDPPENLTWNTSFRMPDNQGRLHIAMRPAQRRKDKAAVLLLELTARGIPSSIEWPNIRNWFSVGRESIVRGFSDVTHPERPTRTLGTDCMTDFITDDLPSVARTSVGSLSHGAVYFYAQAEPPPQTKIVSYKKQPLSSVFVHLLDEEVSENENLGAGNEFYTATICLAGGD